MIFFSTLICTAGKAQTIDGQISPERVVPPFSPTLPSAPTEPEEIAPPPSKINIPEGEFPDSGVTIYVSEFEFTGNTVFSSEELNRRFTAELIGRSVSILGLLQVAADISQYYVDRGYITSGAIVSIPFSTREKKEGMVEIRIIEGELESIEIVPAPKSSKRLKPDYIRNRIALGTSKPFNLNRLQQALQLLQIDPLVDRISVTLKAGSSNGKNILEVAVTEAPTFTPQIFADNSRSPSFGTFRRGFAIAEANLFGFGDGINASYSNTDGSNTFDISYTVPFNPRNGTLGFAYFQADSNVILPPFNLLDIQSSARLFEFTLRQPIVQKIEGETYRELVLGLATSLRDNQTTFLDGLNFNDPAADENGRIRIFATRFFQEFTSRNVAEVLAIRSQFNIGLDALNSTINESVPGVEPIPDSRFFSWRGQGQYARRLAPSTLAILRAQMQLANLSLLSSEQYSLGGLGSVRGYRQDRNLTDNGAFISAEVLVPVIFIGEDAGVVQLAPFIDWGKGWSASGIDNPSPQTLSSFGIGLQLQIGERFSARLDWGIPLISVDSTDKRTWQENGVYFSLQWIPF